MTNGFSGRCLCGAVSFDCDTAPQLAGHCHCVDCRKSSGTGHCTHVIVAAGSVRVHGDITFYDHAADSGNIVSRGFCGQCGCAILSKNSGMPGMTALRASALDDPNIAVPRMVVYASRAPAWDLTDPNLPTFALAPDGGADTVINQALASKE